MTITDPEEFSYEGRLVFNGLHKTTVLDAEFDFEEVIQEDLLDYSEGDFESPGRGYSVIPFQRLAEDYHKIEQPLLDRCGEIRSFRYQEEEWEYREVENDGGTERLPTKSGLDMFDSYWAFPEFLFVKGDKSQAKLAENLLSERLGDYVRLNDITFDPDFLLWIFAKEKSGEKLPGDISVSMLTDAETKGDEKDRFGKRNQVDDSTDITKSAPILIGVLRQKGLVALEGVFGVGQKLVRARISEEGRVHIKADHAISGSFPIERMAISLAFLRSFMTLYDEWKGLEGEEKYPPIQFFEDIYEECKRQGLEITFSIDDVVERYRQKGSPEEYSQYQAGLSEW